LELLGSGRWREKTLTEKADVYFHDYALAHLMIWENYLRGVTPERARAPDGNPRVEACNEMDLTAKAAEAMADGDLVDSMIHG
jgi:replication factor C subunit 1